MQRRDLWRRPEFDQTEQEDPNAAPLPPSCRPHPYVEALNEQHLTRQTAGPSIAASRMRSRPDNDLHRSAEFAVPALPAHVRRANDPSIVGGDARAVGQSITRPMTTALEEEFGMDEEHLATMDLDDPATMPTGADFAIDTSYDGSVFDQSVDSLSVASTSASTTSIRRPPVQRDDVTNEGSSSGPSSGPGTSVANLKAEQKTSSDEDEKEAGRRRRRAALMESAQQQQSNGVQTDGFGRDHANGVGVKPPPVVGGFRFPSDMAVNGNGSNLVGGGRSVSDPAAAANRTGTTFEFSSARGVNRFQQPQNGAGDENS